VQTTCLSRTLVYRTLLRMFQSGLSLCTMEERDLGSVDFKHGLHLEQLTTMVSFVSAHTFCPSRESSPRMFTRLSLLPLWYATSLPYLQRVYLSVYIIIPFQREVDRNSIPPPGDFHMKRSGMLVASLRR